MNLQGIKNRIYWWSKKIVLYGLYFTLCFLVGAFLVLQIPGVQTALTTRIMKKFSKVSGFEVTYDRFHLIWYDRLEIDGLKIIDPAKNTMISAQRIRINFTLSSLWDKSEINIDNATLNESQVNLVKIPTTDSTKDLNMNIFIASINQQFSGEGGGGKSPKLNIAKILLDRSSFSYNNPDKDSLAKGFDYSHFHTGIPVGKFNDFKVIGDTIQFNVETLEARDDKTKLAINELKTFFRYSQGGMEFSNLNLKVGQSTITDTVIFRYSRSGDLSSFDTHVNFHATLRNTIINPSDLALFIPGVEKIGQPLHLDGRLDGKVSRFTYHDMRVGLGKTLLTGQLTLDGLPSLRETFITLNLNEGDVKFEDLKFLFADDVYSRLVPLGNVHARGRFTGFVNDFVANGYFTTQLGKVKSDINLKINEDRVATYHGNLELDQFDLGSYLKDTISFQRVSLNGQIDGKGLTEQTANFSLIGKINSIGLGRYNYLNITTNAQFAKQLFNGKITIDDPHLKFSAVGSIDLRQGRNAIKIKANLDTAWLQELHLSKEKIFISSYIDIDSHGLQLDSLLGTAVLKNSTLTYRDETIHFDSIHVVSSSTGKERKLSLQNSLMDVTLEGDYYYSTLFNDLTNLFDEFYLTLQNDKTSIASYYSAKRNETRPYDAKFQVKLFDINTLANVFDIPLSLSKNTVFAGEFGNGPLSVFHAHSQMDTLRVAGKLFIGNEIDFSGSKIRNSPDVHAALTVRSDRQEFSPVFKTKNLLVGGVWNGRHVDLGIDFDQDGYTNLVRLKSQIDFLSDSTRIKLLPSRIQALEKEWVVDPSNYVLVNRKEWYIHHLGISNGDQLIALDGRISQQPDSTVRLTFANLNLDILNVLSTEKFTGVLNGAVNARDVYHNPYLQNNISIAQLTVNGFLVGDITGSNVWNQQDNRFDLNFFIDRLEKRIVNITGKYNPEAKENPLAITANLQQMNLKIIEPLLRGIFSQIDGTISGKYIISGTFTEPQINGEGEITNGQIMLDYLKTLYSFSGTLGITPNQIVFKDMVLVDAFKNRGTVNGYLAHTHFSEMSINLDAQFANFQLLNTTAKDNNLFYGQGYATGRMTISGPLSNMKISVPYAKTEKNTKIFIPINGTETVDKKEFITFTHFTDSTSVKVDKKKLKKKVELSGITLDLNFDMTPAALVEIIFDIKSGDIIRGRGNGNIKLQLDTKGEFNMFGSVEFTEGAYNFTLYDIINKEFSINKGSRISWFGDPYQATMNITAEYKQLALLGPILSSPAYAASTAPGIRRRYPIEVILKLDGAMLSPQINFDIDAKDLPNNIVLPDFGNVSESLSLDFIAFKARLDEQELKKQVFSLIMLRRFSPIGESISTSGGLSNSVSELFSNQLSYWLSQMDQNLEIDIDLGAFDQEAFNTFQLRLSYSFLNGRLRVTRDGAFNNQYNRSDVSSIAGDWTVDYLLTPDGKFKVKMYSRTNTTNILSSIGTQSAVTTGVSLLHTQNFNQLGDLLRSARERRRRELEKQKNDPDAKDPGGDK
jgi:hypothetical protein